MATTTLDHVGHDVEEHHDDHHGGLIPIPYERQLQFNRLGMWLFLISETFLFAGILVMRIELARNEDGFLRPDVDQFLGLLITVILLASSFSVNRAELGIKHGDRQTFMRFMLAAIIMGLVFVVGVAYEWSLAASHLDWQGQVQDGLFFFMTGIHALHVVTGIMLLMIIYYNGSRGHYSREQHWGVEASALYWHFVDVVWVFFYVALYLVGDIAHH